MNFYKPMGHAVLWAALGLSSAMSSDFLKSNESPPDNPLRTVVVNPEGMVQEKGEPLAKDSNQEQEASIPRSLKVLGERSLKGNFQTLSVPTQLTQSILPYSATYASLPGNYTVDQSWSSDPNLALTPDTGTASNTYYFIDSGTKKYYADQYAVSGSNYTLTVGHTDLETYTDTQALGLDLLPYDFKTGGAPNADCTAPGLYTLPLFTFPADFPVESTIPPTKNPTGKGQIYGYYSQNGSNQNEIRVYQYFVDGASDPAKDKGVNVQLYSYTIDPPAFLSSYVPLPGGYQASQSFGLVDKLSSVLQADYSQQAYNNYYFLEPSQNTFYLNNYVQNSITDRYQLTVTPGILRSYNATQALALDLIPNSLLTSLSLKNGTYYTKSDSTLATELSSIPKGTIKDYYSGSGNNVIVYRFFIDGSPGGSNDQGSRIQLYSYSTASTLSPQTNAINSAFISPNDGDIETLRSNVLSFKMHSRFNNRPIPKLKWEVTDLSWNDATPISSQEMAYSLSHRCDGSCHLTLSPNYIRFNDPDYHPQTGKTDFKVTVQVTDLDVANWLSSKGFIGNPSYSQTFDFTLKAAPIEVSFNEKRVNVFPNWEESTVRDHVKAQFKSSLTYPKQNPPSQGYLGWNFELGANLSSNLSILPGPQKDSWNYISKTFMAEKTLILRPKSSEANDNLTVEVTYRDSKNNVLRFGKTTKPFYLAVQD